MSVRRSAASQPHRSPGTGVVWRLWSEPPDLVQTGSGTRMDLPALCPEQSGTKPAAPSSMGAQSYRSSLDVYEDPVRRLGQLATVKRWRRWVGFSISSMMAVAKSGPEMAPGLKPGRSARA
jgi:hypothetical protein